jgi:hypothetical protein
MFYRRNTGCLEPGRFPPPEYLGRRVASVALVQSVAVAALHFPEWTSV